MRRVGLEEIAISGVMLRREGDYAVVEVERKMPDGTFKWYEVIREFQDSNYSHIVEPIRIQRVSQPSAEGGKQREWQNP